MTENLFLNQIEPTSCVMMTSHMPGNINNNKNNQQWIQNAAAYYYCIRKIVTVISLHLRLQLAKCTPYQHLDCNISHDRYHPDVLSCRSTQQLRLSILPKDTNTLALAGLELTRSRPRDPESCTFPLVHTHSV